MRATAATFRPRVSRAEEARFAKTWRRLENSRTLPLLPLFLLSPSFLPRAFLARAGSVVAVARFSTVCCTERECGSSAGGQTDDGDANERGHRDPAAADDRRNLDQPQALPSATSRSPRHRFARETEGEARATRDSPGSRDSGEGVAGTSERTRASRS